MPPAAQRPWVTTAPLLLLLLCATPLVWAIVPSQDEDSELHQRVLSNPVLHPTIDLEAINATRASLQDDVSSGWSDFINRQSPLGDWNAQIDRRNGLVEIAEGARRLGIETVSRSAQERYDDGDGNGGNDCAGENAEEDVCAPQHLETNEHDHGA